MLPKDEMIGEQQDRRERMHRAVDGIEAFMGGKNRLRAVMIPVIEMLTLDSPDQGRKKNVGPVLSC